MKHKDEMFCFTQNEKKNLTEYLIENKFHGFEIFCKNIKILLFKQKQIDIEYIFDFFSRCKFAYYPTQQNK